MATIAPKRLTARMVESAKPPESGERTLNDPSVPGLHLRITSSGVRSWSVLYRTESGRRRRLTLGKYPALGLAAARKRAQETLRDVALGDDPALEKQRKRRAETFGELAALYLDLHALGPSVRPREKDGTIADVWKFEPESGTPRKRTWKEDRRKLEVDVLPRWRNRAVGEITRLDVRDLIEAKASAAPIAANRLRALLHRIFNFALERDLCQMNPVLKIARPGEEKARDRVLTDDEIRRLWVVSDDMDPGQMGAFFRLLLLTGQRVGEVRGMRWDELDVENRVWTIPAARSKNRKAHRVPLADISFQIITDQPQFDPHVLAGARGNRQFYVAATEIGLEDFQPGRDLRSTAATGMAAAGVQRLHVGLVLNHSDKSVTARHYDRAGYDGEKRAALETWAAKVWAILERREGANVLPFAGRRE